jgi:hypothetical protein
MTCEIRLLDGRHSDHGPAEAGHYRADADRAESLETFWTRVGSGERVAEVIELRRYTSRAKCG